MKIKLTYLTYEIWLIAYIHLTATLAEWLDDFSDENEKLETGHIFEFSCGVLYYRTLYLDPKRDALYIGAMDRIYSLIPQNINRTDCKVHSLSLNPTDVTECISKGKDEVYECRNHIRVIQPTGDGSRLYVCGTNAHKPKEWIIHSNLTHLRPSERPPGIESGIAKCPFDPSDNSTAVWVETGNPEDLPALYSGTVAEFNKADSGIFRPELYRPFSAVPAYEYKRTLKYDSLWLDKPQFVGAFDADDHVLFFFRETAVEYINCGKSVFSRVARVCKRDTGGKQALNWDENWASFLKARLNCSLPGEFPFYFNEIQHVYQSPGDRKRFHAVFTTSLNGFVGSAVCTYTRASIQDAFEGRFKEQTTSRSAWLPVLTSSVPSPRPGRCVNDTKTLPDAVVNFQRTHTLMDQAVAHERDRPVFHQSGVIFTRLVVHELGRQQRVYFLGTDRGKIYKVAQWLDDDGTVRSRLLDVFRVTTPHPVRAMDISSKHRVLYVTSDYHVKQIALALCSLRYNSCVRCVRDPYCGWDGQACRTFTTKYEDVRGEFPEVCRPTQMMTLQMTAHHGQNVHLPCQFRQPASAAAGFSSRPRWYHNNNPLALSSEKFLQTTEHGLVVLSIAAKEGGLYQCRLRADVLHAYNVSIRAYSCSAPTRAHDFQQAYADWCQEFHKYKMAMHHWQQRQAYCRNGSLAADRTTFAASAFSKPSRL